MIKKFFILIALLVSAGMLRAQSEFKPEWNFGAGFGPTFSSVSFDSPSSQRVETKSLQGYHGGIAARYISENHLGVIGEINFSQQGWEQKFKDNPDYQHSHSLTYIEIPVMTHIYFGRKVRFFVNLGPKIQFLISEKEKMSDALANDLSAGAELPNIGLYNKDAKFKFDYGLIGGLGLEFRSGIGNFSLEGRYYFGFGDILDNKAREDNFTRSANRVISAKLTYYTKLF